MQVSLIINILINKYLYLDTAAQTSINPQNTQNERPSVVPIQSLPPNYQMIQQAQNKYFLIH